MNRGSVVRIEARGNTMDSFNEAPIHESGKSMASASITALCTALQ